jgi:hypothetical protein
MIPRETFSARSVSSSFERRYQISAQGSNLYFIQLPGVSETAQALTVHFGLLGILIGESMKKRAQKKAAAAVQSASPQDPEEALRENKHNFKVYLPEIQDAALEPPAFWQLHGKQAGRFRFSLRDGKKQKFEFETPDELKAALDVLPRLLGATLRINVEWDENKKRFQKLKHRY